MKEQLEKARQKMLKAAGLMLEAQRILTPMGGNQSVQESTTMALKTASELEQMASRKTNMMLVEGDTDARQ